MREKGGKAHAMPCHQYREACPTEYLAKIGLSEDGKRPRLRTIRPATVRLTRTPLPQANSNGVIQRRTAAERTETKAGNYSFMLARIGRGML